MKKIYYFLLLALSILGAIGGFGYAVYCKAYLIAVGIGVLAYLAWPKIKDYATRLAL